MDAAVLYVPYSTFTPLVRPCPFVVTFHDCTIESNVGFAGNWLRQAAMRTITGMALRRAAAMTAPSRASLAEIRRYYPAAPNPTLIPNGADVRQFGQVTATAVAAARTRYQLPERFILAVGAHRPHRITRSWYGRWPLSLVTSGSSSSAISTQTSVTRCRA